MLDCMWPLASSCGAALVSIIPAKTSGVNFKWDYNKVMWDLYEVHYFVEMVCLCGLAAVLVFLAWWGRRAVTQGDNKESPRASREAAPSRPLLFHYNYSLSLARSLFFTDLQ